MRTLIILCIVAVLCCATNNDRLTRGNKNSFVRRSYGGDLKNYLHDIPITPQTYKRHLNEELPCKFKYCYDNAWKCKRGDSRNCYNIEHIIDLHGPEYSDHINCKNIAGNMIMAHGEWNQQLGQIARKNYAGSKREKTIVYGKRIMKRAEESIQSCIEKHSNVKPNTIDAVDTIFEVDNINRADDDIIIDNEGIFIVQNITCSDCVGDTCDECTCDNCEYIPYIDDEDEFETDTLSIVMSVLVSLATGILIGGVIYHIGLVYCMRRAVDNTYSASV